MAISPPTLVPPPALAPWNVDFLLHFRFQFKHLTHIPPSAYSLLGFGVSCHPTIHRRPPAAPQRDPLSITIWNIPLARKLLNSPILVLIGSPSRGTHYNLIVSLRLHVSDAPECFLSLLDLLMLRIRIPSSCLRCA